MATKSFLFIVKSSLILLVCVSCVQKTKRPQVITGPTQPKQTEATTTPSIPAPTNSAPVEPAPSIKVGLILGPGALRMYGHVGVLEELVKARISIDHIMGLETGALVAALYAQKGQANDVEWQLFKLKEEEVLDKALIGSTKPIDVRNLSAFLNMTFSSSKIENGKVPFSCPAYNLAKQDSYMMNKGPYTVTLPYCLPLPPLMRSYNQNVAAVMDLKGMIDYLRSKGMQYIIYVNVLTSKEGRLTKSDELNSFWGLINQSLMKSQVGIDYIVHVPLQDIDILDFNKRRDILQKGKEAGIQAANEIANKLGL